MKNVILLASFMLGCISLAHTQKFSFGPSVGANYAWISDAPGDTHVQLGFNAGVTLVYSAEEHWGLGLDLRYSGEGMITKLRGLTAATHLDYLRVPVKVYYFFNTFEDDFRPKIYLGPSAGFLLGGKTEQILESSVVSVDSKDLYEDFDLGVTGGVGFNYRIAPRTWFNFDVTYSHGVTDVVKVGKGLNRNLNLNLGMAFGL